MIDIKSMTPEELAAWLKELGEPAFRAKQVFKWLYRAVSSSLCRRALDRSVISPKEVTPL